MDAPLDLSAVLEKRFMVETVKSRRASIRVSFSNLFLVKRAEDRVQVIGASVNQTDIGYTILNCLLQALDVCIQLTTYILITNPKQS